MANLNAVGRLSTWAHAGVARQCSRAGWVASSGMDSYGEAIQPIIKKLVRTCRCAAWPPESEISGVICFLLSPAASYVNGVTVQIDRRLVDGPCEFPGDGPRTSRAFNGFHRATHPRCSVMPALSRR